MPQAVLFDWDNTILNNQLQINGAIKKTLASMGRDHSNHVFYSGPRIEYFQKHFGNNWQEAEKVFRKHLNDIVIQDLCLFDGIEDLLYFLKDNKVYTAVVSNKLSTSLREEVSHFQLDKFFNKIVGSGDTLFDKPSPEPLFFALRGSGIKPSRDEVFFVGDSIVDMDCAKNAGVTGIIFNNHIPEYIGNRSVQDFNELLDYFKIMK